MANRATTITNGTKPTAITAKEADRTDLDNRLTEWISLGTYMLSCSVSGTVVFCKALGGTGL